MSQAIRYCEEIMELKRRELANLTEASMIANIYANGNLKNARDYTNFIENLRKPLKEEKINVGKTLKSLKNFGVEIEEK